MNTAYVPGVAAAALAAAAALLGAVLVSLREEMSAALAACLAAAAASVPAVSAELLWARGVSVASAPVPFVAGPFLLMGLGWPGVALLHRLREGRPGVRFRLGSWVEVLTLLAASLHGFFLAFKGAVTLVDTGLLGCFFLFYLLLAARVEPARSGQPDWLSGLSRLEFPWFAALSASALALCAALSLFAWRALCDGAVFAGPWAAAALVEIPVLLTSFLLVARGRAQAGLRVLVAAQILQATLGVALLPLAALFTRGLLVQPLSTAQGAGVALEAAAAFYAALSLSGMVLRLSEAAPLGVLAVIAVSGRFLDSYELGALAIGACALIVMRRRSETGRIFPGGA